MTFQGGSPTLYVIGLCLRARLTTPFFSLMKERERIHGSQPQQKGVHSATGECDNQGPGHPQETLCSLVCSVIHER